MFTNKKYSLRHLKTDDTDFIKKSIEQRCSMFLLSGFLELSGSEIENIFLSEEHNNECFYAIENQDKKPIAIFSLINLGLKSKIIFLKIAFTGKEVNKKPDSDVKCSLLKDICCYLFAEEDVFKIIIQVLKSEGPLTKILEMAGFAEEVKLREGFFNFGHYEDVLIFSLFNKKKGKKC